MFTLRATNPFRRCKNRVNPPVGNHLSPEKGALLIGRPTRISNTDTETLGAAFVAAFEVTDIRYAVAYYGPFLREIPRRLGNSTVLDAAVRALSTAYPFFHKGSYPPVVLGLYGQSLRALRECLNNPVEAQTPNTLCALYLITICQENTMRLSLGIVRLSLTCSKRRQYTSGIALSKWRWLSHYVCPYLLRIFDPGNGALMSEAVFFCDEITMQAELASSYRPVGSAYVPLCLVVAWAASENLVQSARIEAILGEYQTDFADIPWISRAIWLASTLDSHRIRVISGRQCEQYLQDTVSPTATRYGLGTRKKGHSVRP
ncbi:hypothetical protein N7457_001969 [Penicillium paradoxum]|uniref:uncharacterized protein n=1 Tax=Penicillium paradoxum TaxID=176176 RepID=UPI0025495A9E|nr:uncharacterized protein N7457_001969 [Penicillium paradoxum]KAJ5786979.1 hypothetical protein N7457_001969 [Penicillium paradoxum]